MAPGGYTTVQSSVASPGAKKLGTTMSSSNCWGMGSRMSANVGLLTILAIVNVVAFLGALRIGLAFYSVPTDTAASESELILRAELRHLNDSSHCSSRPERGDRVHSSSLSSSSAGVEYPVCVILSIGDDKIFPNDKALPFTSLYRLFDVAKAELSEVLHSKRMEKKAPVNLFVGVDYRTVACLMARDTLQDGGEEFQDVGLTCQTPRDVKNGSASIHAGNNPKVSCGKIIVAGSGKYVTQLTLEWAELIHWDDLKIVDVDQPDPSKAPPALPREMWRPTVATAFSSNHFVLGSLLMRSIAKSGREAAEAGQYNISIIVFALEDFNSTLQGILDCLVTELNEDYKIPTEVRKFNFSAYPKWMRINQTKGYNAGFGEYAWKVIMVHEVVAERGFLLWTDAGCRVSYEGLVTSLNYTRDLGYANRKTTGVVPQYVHPGMRQYWRYITHYDKPRVGNCDGSAIGLTMDKYSSMVMPWRDCAMTRQCIAPDGSHHGNHRQDQAALTLLADMSNSPCQGVSMKIRRHMDNHVQDILGTLPTKCYKDPLIVITEKPEYET